MRRQISSKVKGLRDKIAAAARARWGKRWVSPLADAAGINPRTLRTLFSRGQKLPPADMLASLEHAVGLTSTHTITQSADVAVIPTPDHLVVLLDETFEAGLAFGTLPEARLSTVHERIAAIRADTERRIREELATAQERIGDVWARALAEWKADRRTPRTDR